MATATSALSPAELEQYNENGYLAFEGVLTEQECDALLARAQELVKVPKPGVQVQLEPAIAKAGGDPHDMANVRKITGLVEHDDLYARLSAHDNILPRVRAILGDKVRLFRDAFMAKPAKHGSAKPYHQDSAYWNVEPMDLCSVWIALDTAGFENGCMRVIPGSHRGGIIEHKHLEDFQVEDEQVDLSREVAVPLKRGGALFFHSLILHATSPNTSDHPRRAMILSCMGGHCTWTGDPAEEPSWLELG